MRRASTFLCLLLISLTPAVAGEDSESRCSDSFHRFAEQASYGDPDAAYAPASLSRMPTPWTR